MTNKKETRPETKGDRRETSGHNGQQESFTFARELWTAVSTSASQSFPCVPQLWAALSASALQFFTLALASRLQPHPASHSPPGHGKGADGVLSSSGPLACNPLHLSQLLYLSLPCNPLRLSPSSVFADKRKRETEGRQGGHSDQQQGRQDRGG